MRFSPPLRSALAAETIGDPFAHDPLDWRLKGVPDGFATAEDFRRARVSLFDDRLMFPAAVLRDGALRGNALWMRRFVERMGVLIAPHGKTTMAPALFQRQIENGAWAITAATAHHARAYRRFGVERIFLANQLVGDGNIGWALTELREHPRFEFYALVDSADNVAALAQASRRVAPGRPLRLLVEVGREGARTGVRSVSEGVAIAEAITAHAPFLEFAGVETFEGVAAGPNATADAAAMLDLLVSVARGVERLRPASGDRLLLSAGGSVFFDLAARALGALSGEAWKGVLRSGCYLTIDHGLYQRATENVAQRAPGLETLGEGLQPALQVWARVQSIPEPGMVVCARMASERFACTTSTRSSKRRTPTV